MENKKESFLTSSQAEFLLTDPKEATIIWGRRSGKSFIVLSQTTVKRVFDMAGAYFLLMGRTYKQLLERTFSAIKSGWAILGYFEDQHYIVGKKPPKEWGKCKYMPSEWKHTVYWFTGTCFQLGSQDRPGLVNSLTVHGLFADEAKFLNEKRFKEDALPTVSAPLWHFPNSPHNRTIILASSMPDLPQGRWLLDKEKEQDLELNELILQLAIKCEELKQKAVSTNNAGTQANLRSQIKKCEELLNELRKHCRYYSEVSTLANIGSIGWDYIEQQKRVLGDKFYTEILNLRPKTQNAFYTKLSNKHLVQKLIYSAYDNNPKPSCLNDSYNINAPLYLGIDFGAVLNSIVSAQVSEGSNTLTFLSEFFLRGDDGYIIDDVVNIFANYYTAHKNKTIYVCYDPAGNNRTGVTKQTPAEQAIAILRGHGWSVESKTQAKHNALHQYKYNLINTALDEGEPRMLRIRFNEPNLYYTLQSMRNAGTKQERGKLKKDKSSEANKNIDPELATHLSDAVDTICVTLLSDSYGTALDAINQAAGYATMNYKD